MFLTPLSQVTTLAMAGVCMWAILAGRWPERLGGVAVAANWLLSAIFEDRRPYHHLQPAWFALDAGMAAVLLLIVVYSRRRWCLWAAACALLLLFCHVTVLIDRGFTQWSYVTVCYVWSLGILVALGWGVALEGRRPAPPLSWRGLLRVRAAPPSTPSATARRRS